MCIACAGRVEYTSPSTRAIFNFRERAPWEDAQLDCVHTYGGSLATFASEAEENEVMQSLGDGNYTNHWTYIGVRFHWNATRTGGAWMTADNSSMAYTNWYNGSAPVGCPGALNIHKQCYIPSSCSYSSCTIMPGFHACGSQIYSGRWTNTTCGEGLWSYECCDGVSYDLNNSTEYAVTLQNRTSRWVASNTRNGRPYICKTGAPNGAAAHCLVWTMGCPHKSGQSLQYDRRDPSWSKC